MANHDWTLCYIGPVTVLTQPLSLRSRAKRLSRYATRVQRWLSPAKPVLANLASIPFTVAGFGFLAAATYAWNTTVGLASTGVLLIVLEHLIADES